MLSDCIYLPLPIPVRKPSLRDQSKVYKHSAYRKKNLDKWRAYASKYRKKHPEARAASRRKWKRANKARCRKQTPPWADRKAISELYRIRAILGPAWSVDHEIPLRGKMVSGLHVETNLRIIRHAENLSKYNSYPLSTTPSNQSC